MAKHHECPICGSSDAARPWVKLNRIVMGTGNARGSSSFLNDDDEYFWEIGEDLDPEDEIVTGPVLCFPACLVTYIEGRMIQIDIKTGHTE